jgi:16S rRNA processing protein RimM
MSQEEHVRLGRLTKPFGVHGEVRLALDDAVAGLSEVPEVLFLQEDERLFPWFVRTWREHGDGAIVLALEDIDSPERVRGLCGHDVYVDASLVEANAEELGRRALIGYQVIDQDQRPVGAILEILDQTAQWLAVVEHRGRKVMLPLDDALILDLDESRRQVQLRIPEGLLEL